ncbi:hypothetical protein ACKF11_13550 [Methylobacillus sp. Pita2]|uniref:hypothetical protein n=1 Tax=Methylobacillus sp. Pita2 TaxID=3383245 RepID=UPI0038B4F4C7
MSVKEDQIKIGAVFRFPTANRRVVAIQPIGHSFDVIWEYADGVARRGLMGGKKWIKGFAREALEQVNPDARDLVDKLLYAAEIQDAGRDPSPHNLLRLAAAEIQTLRAQVAAIQQ